jgi:hypothetical protein
MDVSGQLGSLSVFTSGKRAPGTYYTGDWVILRVDQDAMMDLFLESKSDSSAVQPVANRCTD